MLGEGYFERARADLPRGEKGEPDLARPMQAAPNRIAYGPFSPEERAY